MGEEASLLSKVRKLCRLLVEEIPPEDLVYVETILGMAFRHALDRDPIALFLTLLERYVRYVQHLVMLHDIGVMFKDLGIEPLLLFENGKILHIPKYINRYALGEVSELYRRLFVSTNGKEVLRVLISRVKNPRLRNRFQRFFLAAERG